MKGVGAVLCLLAFYVATSSADIGIKLQNKKLVSSKYGDKCELKNHGATTACTVKRGEKAYLQGDMVIDGGSDYLGIDSLQITLKLTNEHDLVTKAQTCQKTGGNVVIKGDCATTLMAGGTYPLDPFQVTIPKAKCPAAEVLSIYADIVWSDKSKDENLLVDVIEVIMK